MPLLGALLIDKGLVTEEIIEQALRAQIGGNRRLGHILVRMKAITEDQLAETLANQLGLPFCDIAQRFTPEVRKILPRYLCWQYGILPLATKNNNILEVAMADPADEEAIHDVERYTGKVVEPFLAKYSDIDREIPLRIPLSTKDFFSPRANTLLTRLGVALCLFLITILGAFTYQYIHNTTYGTVSTTPDSITYKNLDLMIGFEKDGKITLLGRGAYAKSYYSVSFNDANMLATFLRTRLTDFSDKQKSWIDWVIIKQQAITIGTLATAQ